MGSFSHIDARSPIVLTVPGLGGSGPSHWQTLWEQTRAETRRAELGMWDRPHRNVWVTKLDQAIRAAGGPVVLAAHSLGCLAVAWWAELAGQPHGWPVAGALLVAPADVDREDAHPTLAAFRPSPRKPLPFASIVVASSDDPWASLDHAQRLAEGWESHFVNIGAHGHINAASALGWWAEGQELLERVIDATPRRQPRTETSARDAPADGQADADIATAPAGLEPAKGCRSSVGARPEDREAHPSRCRCV